MSMVLHLVLAILIAAVFMVASVFHWTDPMLRSTDHPRHRSVSARWYGIGSLVWSPLAILLFLHPNWMIWAAFFAVIENTIWSQAFLRDWPLFKD